MGYGREIANELIKSGLAAQVEEIKFNFFSPTQ